MQLRGLPPFFSPKYDLKKHPNYKYTAEFDKKKKYLLYYSIYVVSLIIQFATF